MPPSPSAGASDHEPAVAGPLGGLLLSALRAASPALSVRAVRWWRDLARLGVHLPLFVVHDVGLPYAAPRELLQLTEHPAAAAALARAPKAAELTSAYREMIGEIARSEAAAQARAMKLGDDLVVVLLARVLGAVVPRDPPPWPASLPVDPDLFRDLDARLPRLFAATPRGYELAVLEALSRARLYVLTLADALDLGTLRLLRLLGSESTAAGALGHVDLLAALASPASNDIVRFSLELLPRVLETSRATAAGVHAVDGYAGVGRQGSVDSMVLTELAWDTPELLRRLADGELLHYTRERAPEHARRLHHVVVDASASMRGEREVFARGLAIALGKKLQLAGEEVWIRFFDSRLYEAHRARERAQLPAAWLLGFKGERGRNPARVFAQLATELALLRAREQRDSIVHLVTHAALHVPRALVQEVRRHAHLFAVFILPSGGSLDLEWLDLLESHAVVDHATLHQSGARAAAATKIVDEAARRRAPG